MSAGGGRYDFDDGGSYCGGWEDGKAHGHGVCTGPKGQGEYSGAWAFGFEASGLYVWPSGNTYTGEWFQGKRHGVGVERKDKWTYRGEWTHGFKGRYGVRQSAASGARYEGTWANGLQDGYGCETYADGGTYQGQWQRGTRHGYGVRQSVSYGLAATYRARTLRTSQSSLHSEDEDDKVVKQRDRKLDESRGGFILTARSNGDALFGGIGGGGGSGGLDVYDGGGGGGAEGRRASRLASLLAKPKTIKRSLLTGLRLRKQRSAGDVNELRAADAAYAAAAAAAAAAASSSSMRSARSFASQRSTSSVESAVESTSRGALTDGSDEHSFYSQDDIADSSVTEMYMGEWNGDKRSGFGVSERSDGLKYEGEWFNNKKYGYGVTTFKDGSREDGKYKNNVLVASADTTSRLLLVQRNKLRERVETSALAARRAAQLALQKADIAMSRMANARAKAELADAAAEKALRDSDASRLKARDLDPKFHQPGLAILKNKKMEDGANGTSTDSDGRGSGGGGGTSSGGRRLSAVKLVVPGRFSHRPDPLSNGGGVATMDLTPSLPLGRHSLMGTVGDRLSDRERLPNGRLKKLPEVSSLDSSLGLLGTYGGNGSDDVSPKSATGSRHNSLLSPAILSDHFDHYMTSRRQPMDATDENHNRTASGAAGEEAATARQTMGRSSTPLQQTPTKAAHAWAAAREATLHSGSGSVGGGAAVAASRTGVAAVKVQRDNSAGAWSSGRGDGAVPPPHRRTVLAEDFNKNVQSKDDAALLKRPGARAAAAALATTAAVTPAAMALAAAAAAGGRPSLTSAVGRQLGSLPDISAIQDVASLSKNELARLGAERRDAIRRLLDENERRRNGDITMLVTDVKKWVQQRQLMMLVFAINLSVASVIYNLML